MPVFLFKSLIPVRIFTTDDLLKMLLCWAHIARTAIQRNTDKFPTRSLAEVRLYDVATDVNIVMLPNLFFCYQNYFSKQIFVTKMMEFLRFKVRVRVRVRITIRLRVRVRVRVRFKKLCYQIW